MEETWVTAEQIAPFLGNEGVTPRRVRQITQQLLESKNGTRTQFARLLKVRGGYQAEYNLVLFDEATQQRFLDGLPSREAVSTGRDGGGPDGRVCILPLSAPPKPAVPAPSALSLFGSNEPPPEAQAIPEARRPLAVARRRAIKPLLNRAWEKFKGQTLHGVVIHGGYDYARALGLDSRAARPALHRWTEIERQLQVDSNDPEASLLPVSPRSLLRWLSWFQKGRALRHCPACAAAAERKTARCSKCNRECRLAKGLTALQDFDRTDKGASRIHPMHQKYLAAAYLGGDKTAEPKLALERRRSGKECWRMLRMEVELGEQPGPAPSLRSVQRLLRSLPASVVSFARDGKDRALAKHGSWVPRSWKGAKPNQIWMADFRMTNVRTWWTADGRLFRVWICAIMDVGSRDVVFLFDRYPSAELFKATLRKAILRWGCPEHLVVDNGKEFIVEELWQGEPQARKQEFLYDDETESTFAQLGITPHRALPRRPTGKAPLERFFQAFDHKERGLPGATGERTEKTRRTGKAQARPQRLTREEKQHLAFCRQERADTPLLHVFELQALLTQFIENDYRLRPHSGSGMLGRAPAQVRAAFSETIRLPEPAALDLLLAYHQRVRPNKETVTITWRGVRLRFRSDELALLSTEELERGIEVRLDPFAAGRAVALVGGRAILLESVDDPDRAPVELRDEMRRSGRINRAIERLSLMGAALAPIDGPLQHAEKMRLLAAPKLEAIEAGAAAEVVHQPLPAMEHATRQIAAAEQSAAADEAAQPRRRKRRKTKVFTSHAEAEETT